MTFKTINSEITYPKKKELLVDDEQLDVLVKNEIILSMMDNLRDSLRIKTVYEPGNDMVKVFGTLMVEVRT